MTPELPEALSVLFRLIDVLDELGVSYHLGGSYASSIHGIPRQTQDIDLVLDLSTHSVNSLVTKLGADFYLDEDATKQAIHDKSSVNFVHLDSGMKIDIFIRGSSSYDEEEFARASLELVQLTSGRHIYVKSPEDILLRKLQWYRLGGEVSDRQWHDVLGIIKTQEDALDYDYLNRWAAELRIEDLLKRAMMDN